MEIKKLETIGRLFGRKEKSEEASDQEVVEKIEEPQVDVTDLFPVGEHGIYAYYGRIGQGKTYAMTADVIEALNTGKVVYTNYPIDWSGYSERKDWRLCFLGLLGLKRDFYKFSADNLRSIEIDEDFQKNFSKLTDCIVAIDEGYVVFDSYEMAKMNMTKRKNVLHTRHFDRSIWYTTQRPTNIHAVMRANTNVFYRCKKVLESPLVVFKREEFDLTGDNVNEDTRPLSRKWYIGKGSIFRAYDTKYLRGVAGRSQNVMAYVENPSLKVLLLDILHALAGKISKSANFESRGEVKYKSTTLNSGEWETAGRKEDVYNDEIPF